MATHPSSWKRREGDAAAIFGARRRPLSGSSNRADIDGDDVVHDRLWIEVKLRASHAVRTLWEKTKGAAKKAGKTPLLMLYDKGKHGALLVMREDDFESVVIEWLAVREELDLLAIEHVVRRQREAKDAGAVETP